MLTATLSNLLVTERRIEQHENVLEVIRNWLKGTSNRLVFVENVGRYALYDSDHQVQRPLGYVRYVMLTILLTNQLYSVCASTIKPMTDER